jgi:hypothetical protein
MTMPGPKDDVANVVRMHPPVYYGDLPVGKVLDAALSAEETFEHVLVVGLNKDGSTYFASSTGEAPLANWMLDLAKADLMNLEGPE